MDKIRSRPRVTPSAPSICSLILCVTLSNQDLMGRLQPVGPSRLLSRTRRSADMVQCRQPDARRVNLPERTAIHKLSGARNTDVILWTLRKISQAERDLDWTDTNTMEFNELAICDRYGLYRNARLHPCSALVSRQARLCFGRQIHTPVRSRKCQGFHLPRYPLAQPRQALACRTLGGPSWAASYRHC